MKPRIYVETSVISYLTARPSRDVIVIAHQQLTRDWWEQRSSRYDLLISTVVLDEASAGDPEAAKRRMALLADMTVLQVDNEVTELALQLLAQGALPAVAQADALHVAAACTNGADYLLTWNCKHIANGEKLADIEAICRALGYQPPRILTPLEMSEAS